MTPKEKAIQLRGEFLEVISNDTWDVNVVLAEKCAIKAVEEILKTSEVVFVEYWEEVKNELEAL